MLLNTLSCSSLSPSLLFSLVFSPLRHSPVSDPSTRVPGCPGWLPQHPPPSHSHSHSLSLPLPHSPQPEELTLLLIKLRRQQAELNSIREHTVAQLMQLNIEGDTPKVRPRAARLRCHSRVSVLRVSVSCVVCLSCVS